MNQIVYDKLLPTRDPHLLKDHLDYILYQGLQALIVKESPENTQARFEKRQAELWKECFGIWERTKDPGFLSELIRVDLKAKTEAKQIRNLKFDKKFAGLSRDEVKALLQKQQASQTKLKMFCVYTQAALKCLDS